MATVTELPPILEAILQAARARFPRHDWAAVEEHIRRAWNAVSHEAPWEDVRDPARRAWERAAH
jgi:hypothetical protein